MNNKYRKTNNCFLPCLSVAIHHFPFELGEQRGEQNEIREGSFNARLMASIFVLAEIRHANGSCFARWIVRQYLTVLKGALTKVGHHRIRRKSTGALIDAAVQLVAERRTNVSLRARENGCTLTD